MKPELHIKICPTCGSGSIKKVVKTWSGNSGAGIYTVPCLSFYECPKCGEKIYDREALQKLEEKSPAFHKAHRRKRLAA